MKKYHDTMLKKIKRLLGAAFLQCLWLVPLCVLVWYGKKHIGPWCANYFGLEEAKKMSDYLALQTERTGSPVMWNPGAIAIHLKTLFLSITATAKYNSLATISDIIAKLVSVTLGLIRFLAIVYAIIRTKRAYFAQKHTDTVSNTLCREIMPEIESLHDEIRRLNALIEKMKSGYKIPKDSFPALTSEINSDMK